MISQQLSAQQNTTQTAPYSEQLRQNSSLRVVEEGITGIQGDLEAMQESVQTISSAIAAQQHETRIYFERNQDSFGQITQQITELVQAVQAAGRTPKIQNSTKDSTGKQLQRITRNEPYEKLISIIWRILRMVDHTETQSQGKAKPNITQGVKESILHALELMMTDEFLRVIVYSSESYHKGNLTKPLNSIHLLQEALLIAYSALSSVRGVMVNNGSKYP